MDGIAVMDVEPAIGTEWRLVGDAPAGSGVVDPLRSGEAIRIATGAVVPEGCARVLPQEILEISRDRACLKLEAGAARFIRRAGADFTAGDVLLERGVRVGPGALGLIAAANLATAEVVREPRIGICAVGDELVTPGSRLREGQSVDSASHSLAALVRSWGGVPLVHPILPDGIEAITAGLRNALKSCDILICIGGASVGRRDLMRPSAAALGAQFLFEGISVQPGKPCWHARLDSGGLILGLPGNPSSAFVCAHLLLKPLIDKLMSRPADLTFLQARSKTPLPANGEREQYLRAKASHDEEGCLWAERIADQDSGLQANLARAQLLVRRLPGAEALDSGAQVEVLELTSD